MAGMQFASWGSFGALHQGFDWTLSKQVAMETDKACSIRELDFLSCASLAGQQPWLDLYAEAMRFSSDPS